MIEVLRIFCVGKSSVNDVIHPRLVSENMALNISYRVGRENYNDCTQKNALYISQSVDFTSSAR